MDAPVPAEAAVEERIAAALAAVSGLEERPVEDAPVVFEAAHRVLDGILAESRGVVEAVADAGRV